jgi:hypothetical protein
MVAIDRWRHDVYALKGTKKTGSRPFRLSTVQDLTHFPRQRHTSNSY